MDYEDITLIKDRAEKNLHALSKTIPEMALKEKEIFAGFGCRQTTSRWGGFLPIRVSANW